MLLSDMQTLCRDALGEDVAQYWTDAMLIRAINGAMREVYAEIVQSNKGFFETTTIISSAVDTELYTFPTGCWKINMVERSDLSPKVNILPIDLTEKNRYSRDRVGFSPGRERYFISGNKIGIAPVPDSTSYQYTVWYVPTPTLLSGASDTLPTEFLDLHHEVIVWGALIRLAMRDRELYKLWEPNYSRLWALLKTDTQNRQVQAPMQTIDGDADF